MILLDVVTFLGRLHPLVVHLPLGFLILAILFKVISYSDKFNYLDQAVPAILLSGFVSAIFACVFGYLLSLSGEYDRLMLRHHKWAGISLAIVSGILYLLSTGKIRFIPRFVYLTVFVLMAGLMAYTGHQGGMLTHGSDFLTMQTLLKQKRAKPSALDQAFLYEDVIQPMLETRCGQCHEGSKTKGGLSMSTLKELLKGGKHGPVIEPGKSTESELMKRVTMDPGQEKFMPTDGKPPLKKNEIAIIRWWIDSAGAGDDKKVAAIRGYQQIASKVSQYLGLTADMEEQESFTQQINPAIPVAADTAAITSLRAKGWMVRWMLKKPAMLDLIMPAGGKEKLQESGDALQKLSKNIIWLNLSDNGLEDGQLSFLSELSNLEKLRLEKNPVSDSTCSYLVGLNHLEAINLNETRVTTAGINALKKNQPNRRVYAWAQGVKDL